MLVVVLAGACRRVPALGGDQRVTVGDNYFVRASGVPTVTVAKGTRVKWVWKGKSLAQREGHQAARSKFGSPSKTSGSLRQEDEQAGTYRLYCSVHGASDQSMKLVVR